MTVERPDDAMMDIGDIDDEPTLTPDPPPRVVIEYRDRGVPWMLIPPLIAAAVVVAVVTALSLNARWNPRRPASAPAATGVDARPAPGPVAATDDVLPLAEVPDPKVVENPPSLPPPVVAPEPVSTPPNTALAPPTLAATVEAAAPAPSTDPTPPPTAQVDAVGFDPAAFTDQATAPNPVGPAAAPVDRNVAVVQTGRPTDAPGGAAVAPADQPEQVDVDLLPPDPRKAQYDRRKRAVEARRKLESERFEFHANLTALTKKLGRRAAPAIHQLCQEFDQDIPPAALEQAKKELGKSGMYAGAGTATRIALLRRLGFPETAILGDIFDIEGRHEDKGSRNAPTRDELYVQSALILLSYPPRSAASARPVPVSTPRSTARPRSSSPEPALDR